ncbi:MAG TPA: hypothetical protein VHS80_13615 [Chthoniobacterales bacterium]|nr:hypothetical protein [Chthoniobacterales bacterium]
MFLIFPRSMVIPEVLEHLEDADFEDWLTAALIENSNQQPAEDLRANGTHSSPNGTHSSPSGIDDLWMLEIAKRTGKVWRGKFQVEFTQENGEHSDDIGLSEQRSGEVLFALDTESAEITFNPAAIADAKRVSN